MGWTSLIGKEVSDEPKLAPKNYRELEPFSWTRGEREGNSGQGSGVSLKEVPFRTAPWQENYSDECGACGSKNTKCIYADFLNDLVGKSDDYELVCLDCGKYTTYHYFD